MCQIMKNSKKMLGLEINIIENNIGKIARNINELSDIISDKSKNDIEKTDQIKNKNNLKKKFLIQTMMV